MTSEETTGLRAKDKYSQGQQQLHQASTAREGTDVDEAHCESLPVGTDMDVEDEDEMPPLATPTDPKKRMEKRIKMTFFNFTKWQYMRENAGG